MLSDLLTRPCTIVRRTATGGDDGYGNPAAETTTVETVCELQQRERPESTAAGTIATTEWALYLPADTSIDQGDAVTIDGVGYEVAGVPWIARHPLTQAASHVEATVTLTRGSEGAS